LAPAALFVDVALDAALVVAVAVAVRDEAAAAVMSRWMICLKMKQAK
jgi:hypothetical protein